MEYDITSYINPELLVISAVLMAAGRILKKAAKVKDKNIPLLLAVVGVMLAFFWYAAQTAPRTAEEWLFAVFSGTVQGILCAAAAVYGHQLVKQAGKRQ